MPEISIVGTRISLTGEWLVPSILKLSKNVPKFTEIEYEVDLSGLSKCDSAGLALLVHWSNIARDQSSSIKFLNCPNGLLEIARISGLESLFEDVIGS